MVCQTFGEMEVVKKLMPPYTILIHPFFELLAGRKTFDGSPISQGRILHELAVITQYNRGILRDIGSFYHCYIEPRTRVRFSFRVLFAGGWLKG
jgi:hypothetical protein